MFQILILLLIFFLILIFLLIFLLYLEFERGPETRSVDRSGYSVPAKRARRRVARYTDLLRSTRQSCVLPPRRDEIETPHNNGPSRPGQRIARHSAAHPFRSIYH